MSGNSGGLYQGQVVLHKGKEKTIKNWHFIGDPQGGHNSDIIFIQFKDGTDTKQEGFTHIEYTGKEKEEQVRRHNEWKEEQENKPGIFERFLLERYNKKVEKKLFGLWETRDLIGSMVVVSHFKDFDLADQVQVGILERIDGKYFYLQGSKRGWRHCRVVEKQEVFLVKDQDEDDE